MRIRPATVDDADPLIALWSDVGLPIRPHEVRAELASVIARDPELVLVAEDGTGLVASVFGAYDGRRGWVNRLATRPDRRGLGVARELLGRLEDALRAKGCSKLNLLVQNDNPDLVDFYTALGYVTDDVTFLGKRLGDHTRSS